MKNPFTYSPASLAEVDTSVDKSIQILEDYKQPYIKYYNQMFKENTVDYHQYNIYVSFRSSYSPHVVSARVYGEGENEEKLMETRIHLESIENLYVLFANMIENIFKAFHLAGDVVKDKEIYIQYNSKQDGKKIFRFFRGEIRDNGYLEYIIGLLFSVLKEDLIYDGI